MPFQGVRGSRSRSRYARETKRAPERVASQSEIDFSFVCTHRALDERSNAGRVSGGYIEGVTPVPIPNTEVKPSRADGTPRETAWESRSLPDIF